MNRPTRSFYFVLAAGITLGLAQAGPGDVQAATSDAAAVYLNSVSSLVAQPAMLRKSHSRAPTPTRTSFRKMMVRNRETMAMVKVEVANGKDPKTKAMAEKLLDQETANARELKELLYVGH